MTNQTPRGRLEIENVSKSYGAHRAVRELSIVVEPGEIVAVLGPSGSGKTTLLGMIGGRLKLDDGDIRIDGVSSRGLPPEKIDTATVFQDYALFPHLSVLENVGFGLRVRGLPRPEARRRALEMLDVVRLAEYADRGVDQLSGGQRQRVATARALAVRPRVLLLDEPLGALDRQIRLKLQEELRTLVKDLGVTAIMVTHDQEEASAMADRIGVMRDGVLVQTGTSAQLYEWPADAFIATFLGGGTILPARSIGGAPDHPRVEVCGGVVDARGTGASPSDRLLVRPEDVVLGPGPAPTWRQLEIVHVLENAGSTRFRLALDHGRMLDAVALGPHPHSRGDRVDCSVKPGRALLF